MSCYYYFNELIDISSSEDTLRDNSSSKHVDPFNYNAYDFVVV